MSYNTFVPPRLPTSQSVQRQIRTKENGFGDEYSQVILNGINAETRTLSLRWDRLRPAQAAQITQFLSAQKTKPFYWQSPYDSTVGKWRCVQWTEDQQTTVVNLSAEFKEVFA